MAKIIIGAALIVAGTLMVISGFGGAAGIFVMMAGASMVTSGVAQKMAGHHSQGIGVVIRQAASPWNVIYGRSRLGGVMIYAVNAGFNNGWFRSVIAHTGHQIQGPIGLYLDGRLVNIDPRTGNPAGGSGDSTAQDLYDWEGNKYNFQNFVHWEWRNGILASPRSEERRVG